MITSEEIKRRLWDGANELRGSMDASRYKDYMLGLMFYKFLSDKTLDTFKNTAKLKNLSEQQLVEEYKNSRAMYGETLDRTIQNILGYYVLPEYLYQTWMWCTFNCRILISCSIVHTYKVCAELLHIMP